MPFESCSILAFLGKLITRKSANTTFRLVFGFAFLLMCCVNGLAGVVRPIVEEGDWLNDEIWSWKDDYGSKDSMAQVPQSQDIVHISHPTGTTITLSEQAPKLHAITIGNSDDATPLGRLVIRPGGMLEAATLTIGRPGGSRPTNGGSLEMENQSICTIAFETIVGGIKNKLPLSNGFLMLKGGQFTTNTLRAGQGGNGSGSLISIKGILSEVVVNKNAEIWGPDETQKAFGVTLEFIPDSSGISPIYIGGDLELKNSPGIRIDFAEFPGVKVPSKICLITVSGVRSGDFSPPEFHNLPPNTRGVVTWDSDNSLMLELSN